MKTKLIANFCLMILASVCLSFAAKPSPEYVKAMSASMTKLLDSREYTIDVGSATPLKGGSVVTQSRIILKGDKVFSGVPFFGNSQVSFNSEQSGYRFECPISDYQVVAGKKAGSWKVTFTATDKNRSYRFKLDVFYNGTTFINLVGGGLDPMNYQGSLKPTPGDIEK